MHVRYDVGRPLLWAAIMLVLLQSGCIQRRQITVNQAETIAMQQLKQFCKDHGLEVSQFSKPTLLGPKTLYGEDWWLFQYQFIGRRNAKIGIAVSTKGQSDICGIGPGILTKEKSHQ